MNCCCILVLLDSRPPLLDHSTSSHAPENLWLRKHQNSHEGEEKTETAEFRRLDESIQTSEFIHTTGL